MITITLTFRTVEAARQALLEIPTSALVGGPVEPAAPAEIGGYMGKLFEAEAAAKSATKAPKAKPAPAPVVAEPAPVVAEPAPVVAEPEPTPAPAPAAKAVTSEEVRAFLAPFLRDAENVSKVQALLKDFDALRLSSIPSEKLGDFLTKAKEVFA